MIIRRKLASLNSHCEPGSAPSARDISLNPLNSLVREAPFSPF